MASFERLKQIHAHRDNVLHALFSPNAKQLATASLDTSVRIWDTQTWELVHTLPHNKSVTTISWNNKRQELLSCTEASTYLWDTHVRHVSPL
jgi:WD40 repeat protein